MKLYLAILIACLLVAHTLGASASVSANEQETTKESGLQSQELARAEQLNAQVIKLFSEKKYDEALPLAKQVLEIREKALGPDHLLVALALQNVVELFIAKRKQKEAVEFYHRLLTVHEKSRGANAPQPIGLLERYLCLLTTGGTSDEIASVRKRLFTLENHFDEDESTDSSGKSSTVGKVMAGRALSLPKPYYSAEARDKRISGSVVMKVKVDETGKVIGLKTLCGHPLLAKGSEPAVWDARFAPAVIAGQPVKFTSIVIYNFIRQ